MLRSTGANLVTALPTFSTPASPACVAPTYALTTSVNAGSVAVATVSLTPNITSPT